MTKVLIWTISIILVGAIVTAVIWKNPLTPRVNFSDLETAIVEIGTVIKTVPAQGIVEPENEVLLLSPASAVITSIQNGVGSKRFAMDQLFGVKSLAIGEQGATGSALIAKDNN